MKPGRLLEEKLVQPFRIARGSPRAMARGASMGLWVALTPTVGFQMLLVAFLAVPLRANVAVALAMVWVSNPITVIPLYFAYYWLGTVVLGVETLGYGDVHELLRALFATDARSIIGAFGTLGAEIGAPMLVGSFVIATLAGAVSYPLTLRWARRRRDRRLGRLAAARVVQAKEAEP